MKESIDDIIIDKIKDAFGNWEEPYLPEDWEKFVQKKKRKKRTVWIPFRYAAILVLLFGLGIFLIGLYTVDSSESDNVLPFNTKEQSVEKGEKENPSSKILGQPTQKITINGNVSEQTSGGVDGLTKEAVKEDRVGSQKKESNLIAGVDGEPEHIREHKNEDGDDPRVSKKNGSDRFSGEAIVDSDIEERSSNILNQEKESDEDAIVQNSASVLEKPRKENLDELALDKELKKNIKYSVALSPTLNYNKSTGQSKTTLSGGAFVEVPIAGKFNLYTGLSLVNQKISFEENELPEVREGTQLKSREMLLTGLELPINLKYNFALGSKNAFAAIGVSSTTYFRGEIESTFQESRIISVESVNELGEPMVIEETVNSLRTENQDLSSDSKKINFGNILHFSFGMEIPINSQKQVLIVEPFIKSSISPITREKINFTSTGISFRMNFGKN